MNAQRRGHIYESLEERPLMYQRYLGEVSCVQINAQRVVTYVPMNALGEVTCVPMIVDRKGHLCANECWRRGHLLSMKGHMRGCLCTHMNVLRITLIHQLVNYFCGMTKIP